MIDDGTAWDTYLPLVKALRKRQDLVGGYQNPTLEEKRIEAIAWLRMHSGWIADKVIRRNPASLLKRAG